MSAIATFNILPQTAVAGLVEAAGNLENYRSYIAEHSTQPFEFEWSGFVFATLLPILDDDFRTDLMGGLKDQGIAIMTKIE
jgi:hypothetical protein